MNRWAVALTVALAAAPGSATAAPARQFIAPLASARILVMPFENVTRDARIFWLSEAAAVLLTDDLNALGAGAITRTERQQAFERLQVPPAAVLTDATIIRIGQLVGASQVVVGSLQMEGDVVSVRARSIALDTGRVPVNVTEQGPLPELYATFERIARRMAPASPASQADVERQHPPVTVFEAYIKGLLADTPSTAVSYLRAALAGQPSFDRARLALWDVYAEQGDHAQALAAVVAVPDGSPWAHRARFLAGLSQLHLKKLDDAFATFKTLADAEPSPALLNNLGVVQLRRGVPQAPGGQAEYFFDKAATADRDDEDFLFNLGYAYWLDRDPQAAIYWLREAVRRNPADADAHFVLAAALAGGSNASEFGTLRAGDANNNNLVNTPDFTILKLAFGTGSDPRADFDNNGVVNLQDFTLLKGNFGQAGGTLTCP